MVENIAQAVDIVVPWMQKHHENQGDPDIAEKIVNISGYRVHGRPVYQITQRKYLPSIRRQLQANHRILSTTYSTYAYYSCHRTEMEQKVVQHMKRTNAYRVIMEFNNKNLHHLDRILKHIEETMITTLNQLFHDKLITETQWQRLLVKRTNSRLDTLYFLPDTRQVTIANELFLIIFSYLIHIGSHSILSDEQQSPSSHHECNSFFNTSSSIALQLCDIFNNIRERYRCHRCY